MIAPTLLVALILLAAAGLAGLVAVGIYNGLVARQKLVDNGWAQIDVQLKRRHDLIPNLVETVKGYAAHEKGLLENVTRARSRALDARTEGVGAQIQAETALGGALRGFMLQVEAYPQLRANENFKALQEELTSTENRISFARQNYNDSATVYNTEICLFPKNLIAGLFHFRPRELWQIAAAEREAPPVKF
ncbi:MAG: LemA family protein [Lentisphaeria bacterium]|jgi:LemA protein